MHQWCLTGNSPQHLKLQSCPICGRNDCRCTERLRSLLILFNPMHPFAVHDFLPAWPNCPSSRHKLRGNNRMCTADQGSCTARRALRFCSNASMAIWIRPGSRCVPVYACVLGSISIFGRCALRRLHMQRRQTRTRSKRNGACACVCLSVWTHTLTCPLSTKEMPDFPLFSPSTHTHTQTHTHTLLLRCSDARHFSQCLILPP